MVYYNEAAQKFEALENSVRERGYGFAYALFVTMIGHGDQQFNERLKEIWEYHPYVMHTIDSVRIIRMMLIFVGELDEYINGNAPTLYNFDVLFPNYDYVVYQIQSNHRLIEQAVSPNDCCEIYKDKDFTVWFPIAIPEIMQLLNPAVEMFQTAVDLKINLKIVHEILSLMHRLSVETTMCDLIDKGAIPWEVLQARAKDIKT